jgi:hypothetical protein
MADSDVSNRSRQRGDDHDRWLVMRSAYAEYKRASEALESADQSIEDSATAELVRLGLLERQQRVAFECYVQARIDFLEFRYDEANRSAPGHLTNAEDSGIRSWLAVGKRHLSELAMVLLCVTALWLVREHQQVRALETARDELRAALYQTRKEIQLLGQQKALVNPTLSHMQQPLRPSPAVPRSTTQKSPRERQSRRHPGVHAQQKQTQKSSPSRKSAVRRPERTTASNFR